jgi:cytochrome b subunit of formate dehydrogenase
MVDERAQDGLEEVLEILQERMEKECQQALGDEQPEEITEELKSRIKQKVTRDLKAELLDVLDRMGHEVTEKLEAKIRKEEKVRRREEEFQRFGLQFRIQHIIMFLSVFMLIFTGLPLKFPDLVISEYLIALFGGIHNSTVLHRVGAGGLIFVAFYHTLYTILSRQGRWDFFLLIPRPKDVKDLYTQVKYFLGRSNEHAKFGRFSYIEKFDYWAVYWGCVIMIGSGALLWFQDITLLFMPKYMLDIAKEAHSDEALLATLAIVIWHFYNVHFNPERFPGSLTWWHGRISQQEMMEHHGLEYERIMSERAALEAAKAEASTEEGAEGQSQRNQQGGGKSFATPWSPETPRPQGSDGQAPKASLEPGTQQPGDDAPRREES